MHQQEDFNNSQNDRPNLRVANNQMEPMMNN